MRSTRVSAQNRFDKVDKRGPHRSVLTVNANRVEITQARRKASEKGPARNGNEPQDRNRVRRKQGLGGHD